MKNNITTFSIPFLSLANRSSPTQRAQQSSHSPGTSHSNHISLARRRETKGAHLGDVDLIVETLSPPRLEHEITSEMLSGRRFERTQLNRLVRRIPYRTAISTPRSKSTKKTHLDKLTNDRKSVDRTLDPAYAFGDPFRIRSRRRRGCTLARCRAAIRASECPL